jgi:DNA adenine methylase
MSEADHIELLELVRQVRGKVMLSGYPSALDDDALAGWKRHEWVRPSDAGGGRTKARRAEVLWTNW